MPIAISMFMKRTGVKSVFFYAVLLLWCVFNDPLVALSMFFGLWCVYTFTSKTIIGSNLLYWVVTNLSVWYAWYDHSWAGFYQCYSIALPYLIRATIYTAFWLFVLNFGYKHLTKYLDGRKALGARIHS